MFVQSVLKDRTPKANKRVRIDRKIAPGKRKRIGLESFNGLGNRFKGSITDDQSPHSEPWKWAAITEKSLLPAAITPWKVIFASFMIGVCGILYINHLFTTQRILTDVQQMETEFNKIRRIHADRQLEYDRLVGPKEIYQRARDQGFINAGPADQLLILN